MPDRVIEQSIVAELCGICNTGKGKGIKRLIIPRLR